MRFREFFDRVSIINLPERTDRRAEMMLELERADLLPEPGRIEFFPAVKVSEAAGFPNAGYHGCFRSHLGILKQALDARAANLLAIEDDLAIAPRFRQDETSLIEQLQNMPWGITYFGHMLEPPADRPTILRPYNDGVSLSHFYAVNGIYIERLTDFFEKILTRPEGHPDGGPMSPDGALYFFLTKNPDVPCHVASPNLGTQRSSRSDLSPKWFDQIPGINYAAAIVRKGKRWLKG